MRQIQSRKAAVVAIKNDINSYRHCSKKLKNDIQILMIALHEIEPVMYCTDEWDMLVFNTNQRLRPKFIEAMKLEWESEDQVRMLIKLLRAMEDPTFYYSNRKIHSDKYYFYPLE